MDPLTDARQAIVFRDSETQREYTVEDSFQAAARLREHGEVEESRHLRRIASAVQQAVADRWPPQRVLWHPDIPLSSPIRIQAQIALHTQEQRKKMMKQATLGLVATALVIGALSVTTLLVLRRASAKSHTLYSF